MKLGEVVVQWALQQLHQVSSKSDENSFLVCFPNSLIFANSLLNDPALSYSILNTTTICLSISTEE